MILVENWAPQSLCLSLLLLPACLGRSPCCQSAFRHLFCSYMINFLSLDTVMTPVTLPRDYHTCDYYPTPSLGGYRISTCLYSARRAQGITCVSVYISCSPVLTPFTQSITISHFSYHTLLPVSSFAIHDINARSTPTELCLDDLVHCFVVPARFRPGTGSYRFPFIKTKIPPGFVHWAKLPFPNYSLCQGLFIPWITCQHNRPIPTSVHCNQYRYSNFSLII